MAGRAADLEMQGLHRDEGSRHAGRIDAPGLNSQRYRVLVSGEVRICGKARLTPVYRNAVGASPGTGVSWSWNSEALQTCGIR
jgi:hypothetical protein